MKLYLDADIFLALIKENDRFKLSAKNFFSNYSDNEFITSTLTCLELWFYLYKNGFESKVLDSILSLKSLCIIEEFNVMDLENAIILARIHKLSPADALHAVLAAKYDKIVSSDSSFDRVEGLTRLDYSK